MKKINYIMPTCEVCGDELIMVNSGLVCFNGCGKIKPMQLEQEQYLLPFDEARIKTENRVVGRGAITAGNAIARGLRKLRRYEERMERERMERETREA